MITSKNKTWLIDRMRNFDKSSYSSNNNHKMREVRKTRAISGVKEAFDQFLEDLYEHQNIVLTFLQLSSLL